MLRRLKRWVWSLQYKLRHSVKLAYVWRSLMVRTKVIAITGSVGKTTCRELLYRILQDHACVYRTPNNENDLYGVPGVILGIRPWHRFAVIELGAGGPGTMATLARLVRPDIAVVTTVARTHTNRYRSIDQIAEEKSQLVKHLRRGGQAVLNGDDPYVGDMADLVPRAPELFGMAEHNGVRATQVEARWPARLSLTVTGRGESIRQSTLVRTNLVGAHWVNSVLAAIATAGLCGISTREAAESIADVAPYRARMQPVHLPNGAIIIRDENASIDVLNALLRVAAEAQAERKVLVLGDVTDSGEKRSRRRSAMVGELVAPYVDFALFVGQSGQYAAAGAVRAGLHEASVAHAETLKAADRLLASIITQGDLVFVKGLGTQHLSRLVFARFGEIGCWVDRCTIRKDCDVCASLNPEFDLEQALRWTQQSGA